MSDALPEHYKEIANSMGISLYQRFSLKSKLQMRLSSSLATSCLDIY